MADLVAVARGGEDLGEVAGAVVGHDAFDTHASLGEPGDCAFHEPGTRRAFFVVEDLDVDRPAVVINGDVDAVPAVPAIRVGAGRCTASDAVAWPTESAQLLDVEVDELVGERRS